MPEPYPNVQLLVDLAQQIEVEMRATGLWSTDPPSEAEVLAAGPFGGDSVTFETWLQVALIGSLPGAAEADAPVTNMGAVAIRAAREWEGMPERKPLLRLLFELAQATAA